MGTKSLQSCIVLVDLPKVFVFNDRRPGARKLNPFPTVDSETWRLFEGPLRLQPDIKCEPRCDQIRTPELDKNLNNVSIDKTL